MKKEKPQPTVVRLYKYHRILVRKHARQHKISYAEFVRRAIENYAKTT